MKLHKHEITGGRCHGCRRHICAWELFDQSVEQQRIRTFRAEQIRDATRALVGVAGGKHATLAHSAFTTRERVSHIGCTCGAHSFHALVAQRAGV